MIPDLAMWVQCFSMYMVVVTVKKPARTKNLLAYQAVISICSQKFRWPSWAVYDQNFRQEAAETGLKDWSKMEPSIYKQCFTGAAINPEIWCRQCYSIDYSSEACPAKPLSASCKTRLAQQALALPTTHSSAPTSRKRPPPPPTVTLSHAKNSISSLGTISSDKLYLPTLLRYLR